MNKPQSFWSWTGVSLGFCVEMMVVNMYKIITYIPHTALEVVKEAMFRAGAGQFGRYSHCSWQVLGQGQFLPLAGANPALGQVGQLEVVDEWRVEMIVPKDKLSDVVRAYKTAHPYEVPAYEVYQMVLVED